MLPAEWNVPAVFRSRLGDAVGRQRAMEADGHLLLVLHQPPSPAEAKRRGRTFWRDPAGTWKSSAPGDGAAQLKRHVAEFADRLDELEKQWQSARGADDYYKLLRALAPLHRTARNLHAVLQEAREKVPADRELINLRDRAGEVERGLELLHGDARNALDYTAAKGVEEQSQRMYEMAVASHRLNLLAALFFPLATLGAVFGMSLESGLRDMGPVLFWVVLGLGLACGLIMVAGITRPPPPPGRTDLKAYGRKR